MRVYHFLNARYGLEALTRRRLRISRILELNDPFEFLGVDLSDRDFRVAIRETKRELSEQNGVVCFSKTWKDPVLWSHYADKHRGVCLGFDVPNVWLHEVTYVEKRPPRPPTLDEAFMKHLLFSKFAHWYYEQEYRAFVHLDEEDEGHYFMDFSRQLKLKEVIVGDQSALTRAEVAAAIRGVGSRVVAFKARAGYTTFNVVRQLNQAMWA